MFDKTTNFNIFSSLKKKDCVKLAKENNIRLITKAYETTSILKNRKILNMIQTDNLQVPELTASCSSSTEDCLQNVTLKDA